MSYKPLCERSHSDNTRGKARQGKARQGNQMPGRPLLALLPRAVDGAHDSAGDRAMARPAFQLGRRATPELGGHGERARVNPACALGNDSAKDASITPAALQLGPRHSWVSTPTDRPRRPTPPQDTARRAPARRLLRARL